ncbi:MAG: 16S rRNA (adenine(1518)-N(6)/adenine(1519)-N(6))-dimethyltransferase RsmA [Oscillospiraceae bacterium]|nr:16S rRNA (adenine(1518)-N(6)/adenine(1519)-N(6))-dimethyltransferase RsmA [Oscillospiraceae bacterium]
MNELTDIKNIRDILSRHGFTFSKALGQNFLVNPSVCPRIAELGNAKKGFGIIEIGTGIGVLTSELAKRADKVTAVEIDTRLMPILAETLAGYDNVHIVNADVMKTDLAEIIRTDLAGLETAVCANLPYYITSPVIMRLLESRLPIRSITVMVQKEAGVRLCAMPATRECGAVTYAVRYYAEPEMLFKVSRGSFMPPPNVDSCVIRLNIREKPPFELGNEEQYFRVVRGAFSQRRKTAANSISSALGIEKSDVISAIEKSGAEASARPEQLTPGQFADISQLLMKGNAL